MLMLKLMKKFFYFLLPKSMPDFWSNALAFTVVYYTPHVSIYQCLTK